MKKDRLVGIWVDLLSLVLPLLLILAGVLGWPPAVQIGLTIAFGVAVVGTRIALHDRETRRAPRARRRGGGAGRRARSGGARGRA